MKQERVKNICREILDKWKNGKQIRTDRLFIFLEGVVDLMRQTENETPPQEYKKLSRALDEMYQYREYEQLTAEEAFVMGSIWSGIKTEELYRARAAQQVSMNKLVRKYENYRWFLRAIYNNPGIKHKDLAAKGKRSTSELSQLTTRLREDGLFTYDRAGREKYYYLQERGVQVYDELKKVKREQRNIYVESVKAISTSNRTKEDALKGYIREEYIKEVAMSARVIPRKNPWTDNTEYSRIFWDNMLLNLSAGIAEENNEGEKIWKNQMVNY